MILYETYSISPSSIKEVEAVRVTEKSVWLADRKGRQVKHSDWLNYWNTYEEAKLFLINQCQRKITSAENKMKKQLEIMQELEKL